MNTEANTESDSEEVDGIGTQTLAESSDSEKEEEEEEAKFITEEEFERIKIDINSQKTGLASNSKFIPFIFSEIRQETIPPCFQPRFHASILNFF